MRSLIEWRLYKIDPKGAGADFERGAKQPASRVPFGRPAALHQSPGSSTGKDLIRATDEAHYFLRF